MNRTRINNNGTMDEMGKNKDFPGFFLKHSTFDGEHWVQDWIKYFATEYEAELQFKKIHA